ncbi:MAG: phasin family protein [Leptolyngbyaceae cyanobacterium]
MAGFGDLVQKAFYLGVGAASYAGEKASGTLKDLQGQAQKLVNELVERGELTAEEAQQVFNNMMRQAQETAENASGSTPEGPRRIEILEEETSSSKTSEANEAEALRQQVEALRQQLDDLKRKDV